MTSEFAIDHGLPASLLLNALHLPVVVISPEGIIAGANAAGEAFFGSGAAVLRRRSLADYVPFASPVLQLVEQVREQGTPVNEYRLDLSSPRLGAERFVDVFAAPVAGAAGTVMLVLHERSMAEKIGRQLNHRGSARSVAALAAMLAHEIKNPLAGIRGAAQLLEENASAEDRELTQLIMAETDRIVSMVGRMEAFADRGPLERKPVNIHTVLAKVKAIAASGFARHVRIIEQYDPSLPPVEADLDLLVQAFVNLVKNAAEALAGRTDGEIVLTTAYRPGIRLRLPGSEKKQALPLHFAVSDNGPGIAEELVPIIFDPFITSKQNGSGLGLAMAAKIISDHGGIIECDSSPDGTSFRIFMPEGVAAEQMPDRVGEPS